MIKIRVSRARRAMALSFQWLPTPPRNETFTVSAMRDIWESCLLGLVLWHKQAFALTNFKAIRVGTSNDNYRIQATCTCKFFSTLVVNTFKKRGSMRVTPSSHVHWFPEQTFVLVRTYMYVVDPRTHEYYVVQTRVKYAVRYFAYILYGSYVTITSIEITDKRRTHVFSADFCFFRSFA